MSLSLNGCTFDAKDASRLASFWAEAAGYRIETSSPEFAHLIGDGPFGPRMLFIQVPEQKTAKNRMHVDLAAEDLPVELERLMALGATLVDRHLEWGIEWAVLKDPEGNEFCVSHPAGSSQ